MSLRRKEANEQLLRKSKGREFQIVRAATQKLLDPKHARTRGTDNRLVSDERNVRDSEAHSEDFVILACTVLIQITSVTDGRTDDGKDARSILLSRIKMHRFQLGGQVATPKGKKV